MLKNISTPTTFQGLHATSYGIVFLCGCVCWYSKSVAHCFIVFLMSPFIFAQYNDSLIKSFIFLIPTYLPCNCSNICLWNKNYNIILLSFMEMPSIIASSSLIGQYCIMLCSTGPSCLASLALWTILAFKSLHIVGLPPVYLLWCTYSICTNVLMACMFIFMLVISWTLFSTSLFWDNQSTMYRSGPGFYMICTLYCWMHSMMHCK